MSLLKQTDTLIDSLQEEMVGIRRHLHMHPELSHQEV